MIKGYTLFESVIVLLIVSMTMILSIPILKYDVTLFDIDALFTSELVCLQQHAYLHNERYDIEIEEHLRMKHTIYGEFSGSSFHVTQLGRVNKPVTIEAKSKSVYKKIKVWLGMGRVHVEG